MRVVDRHGKVPRIREGSNENELILRIYFEVQPVIDGIQIAGLARTAVAPGNRNQVARIVEIGEEVPSGKFISGKLRRKVVTVLSLNRHHRKARKQDKRA